MLRRAQRLGSFRNALVQVGAHIESIEETIAERSHKDPGHVLDRQHRALTRLKQFHGLNIDRLIKAQAALEEYRLMVQRKESEWCIALEIEKATLALNPSQAEDLIQDLLTDTALRTVQDRFNAVFAELDIEMRSTSSPTHGYLQESELTTLDALELPRHSKRERDQ